MIAEKIRTARLEHKLSQAELARRLHVHYNAVWGWESGKYLPRAKLLLRLCEMFNLSFNDLNEKKN